ncbi:hypothetical protein V6N13_053903 [Hibiscus sabdariffa]
MESTQNSEFVVTIAGDREVDAVSAVAGAEQIDATNNEESTTFTKRKRKKTSGVWEYFRLVKLLDGTDLCECIHCGLKIKKFKKGITTPFHRHVGDCPKIKAVNKGWMMN